MPTPTAADLADTTVLWDFLRIDDVDDAVDEAAGSVPPSRSSGVPPASATLALVLGSHDLAPAVRAAELYRQGRVTALLCTGATSPTTATVFPQGEAAAFAAEAVRQGVPGAAVHREDRARSTVENIARSRRCALDRGLPTAGLVLVGKPYQLRYARAVCARLWPGPTVRSTAERTPFAAYAARLGTQRVVAMLVGDVQRVAVVPRTGLAAAQAIPDSVALAWGRLVAAGHTDRLIPGVRTL